MGAHTLIVLSLLQKDIAKNITTEQGKTLIDAEGDVMRGLRKLCTTIEYVVTETDFPTHLVQF